MPAHADQLKPNAGEWIAIGALCLGAVGGPLLMGSTRPWPRFGLEALMALAILAWAASGRRPWRLLAWPLLVTGLVMLQLVPLPDALLTWLAPLPAAGWRAVLAGSPEAWGRISIDPAATAAAARRLLLGLTTVSVVADLGRFRAARTSLVVAIGCVGIAVWALGVAFPFDPAHRRMLGIFDLAGPMPEWWTSAYITPGEGGGFAYRDWKTVADVRYAIDRWIVGDPVGTYVISNHFAAGIYLTLPIVVAACSSVTRPFVPAFVRHVAAIGLFAGAVWTVGVMAHSRAGSVAVVMAGLVFLALAPQARVTRWLAASCAVAGFVAILGFVVVLHAPGSGIERLVPDAARPAVTSLLHDGRGRASLAALQIMGSNPALGTGLSTYGDLYPRLVSPAIPWFYAHNDWFQVLAETGLAGAALLLAAVGLWARRLWDAVRAGWSPARVVDAGVWAALAGIAVHSFFDWNMHVPANAYLAALVAGLAAAVPRRPLDGPGHPKTVTCRRQPDRWLQLGLAAAAVVACMLLARDAVSERVQRRLREGVGSDRVARDHLTLIGERMVAWDPGNPRLAEALAHVHAQGSSPSSSDRALHWLRAARILRAFDGPENAARATESEPNTRRP